jgi:GNAT superfamily N-acetyltransferase
MSVVPELRFRSATREDLASICSVLHEAGEYLKTIGPAPLWAPETIAADAIEPVVTEFEIASIDGVGDVAVLRFQLNDDLFWSDVNAAEPHKSAAYVHKVGVRRSVAGTGVADALLAHAKRRARAAGFTHIRLDCAFEERPKLVAFYERNGYVKHSLKAIPFYPNIVQRFEQSLADTNDDNDDSNKQQV